MILKYSVFYSYLALMSLRLFEDIFRPKYVFYRKRKLLKKYGFRGKNYHDLPYILGGILFTSYAILYAKLFIFWIIIFILEILMLYALFIYRNEENDNYIYNYIVKQKYNAKSKNRKFGILIRISIILIWIYSWSDLTVIFF